MDWLTLEEQAAVKFALKHKPRFVGLADGRTALEVHPEDAHLFAECEIIDAAEVVYDEAEVSRG